MSTERHALRLHAQLTDEQQCIIIIDWPKGFLFRFALFYILQFHFMARPQTTKHRRRRKQEATICATRKVIFFLVFMALFLMASSSAIATKKEEEELDKIAKSQRLS